MNWIEIYAASFVSALVLTLLFTPLCKRLAVRFAFLDIPKCEGHKLHQKATPLLGGPAMLGAFLLTVCGGVLSTVRLSEREFSGEVLSQIYGMENIKPEFVTLCLCAVAATALGLYDDRHSMKAWKKLIGQILIAAAAATWGGISITIFVSVPAVSWGFTVFWLVLIFNAINFFDNMDGLAAGTSAIAFTFFAIAAAVNQQFFVASFSAAAAGAAYGFWAFNRSPASIFMGDSGSHFLGFMLGVVSAKVTYYTPGISTTRFTVLIPVFILAIPLLDTLTVVLIRWYHHKPVYVGDHNHISHRFLHMGLTRAGSVSMVHLLCLIAGLGALPLLWGDEKTCFMLIVQGLAIFAMVSFLQYNLMKKDSPK